MVHGGKLSILLVLVSSVIGRILNDTETQLIRLKQVSGKQCENLFWKLSNATWSMIHSDGIFSKCILVTVVFA